MLALVLCLPLTLTAGSTISVIKNPYAGIDWENVNAYRANFHCHTVQSDGRAEPGLLIQNYAMTGYQILAITDHDNFHRNREGERRTTPTHETTWPWTRWIDDQPSRIWEHNGMESSAFYPTLGEKGMLAIRGNELTTDPHIISLFNDCGFPERGSQTDDEQLSCVQERGGLSYYAHPSDYREDGRWQGRYFDPTLEGAVDYFAPYIARYPSCLGIEFKSPADIELWDALLLAIYRHHDVFLFGSDDRHNTSPPNSRTGRLTLVLASELTEEAVRHAMESGHMLVGHWGETYPAIQALKINDTEASIQVRTADDDAITWIVDGVKSHEGHTFSYASLKDAVVRFEINHKDRVFYSQPFYIGSLN